MAIYMKIDAIKGDVTADNYQNWIELENYDVNVKKPINTQPGSLQTRVASLPQLSQLSAIKRIDRASPLLFSNCCQNKSLGTVIIRNNRTDAKLRYYLEIKLFDSMLSYYDLNCSNQGQGQSEASETLLLSYGKFEIKFIPRDAKNQPQSPISAGYDLGSATVL